MLGQGCLNLPACAAPFDAHGTGGAKSNAEENRTNISNQDVQCKVRISLDHIVVKIEDEVGGTDTKSDDSSADEANDAVLNFDHSVDAGALTSDDFVVLEAVETNVLARAIIEQEENSLRHRACDLGDLQKRTDCLDDFIVRGNALEDGGSDLNIQFRPKY